MTNLDDMIPEPTGRSATTLPAALTSGPDSGLGSGQGSGLGPQRQRGGLAAVGVAGALGCCAVIHAVAAWVHRSDRQLMGAFVALAIGQFLLGWIALRKWNKFIRALIIVVSLAATGGWLWSRTRGLPQREVESIGLGDAISAALQVVAASIAAFSPGRAVPKLRMAAGAGIIGALSIGSGALAVPQVLSHGRNDELFTGSISAVWGAHSHIHSQQADAGLTGNGIVQKQPKSCNPSKKQVTDADRLVAKTAIALRQWDTPEKALAAGFKPLGFEPNGVFHYLSPAFIKEPGSLDPNKPESIVYGREPDGTLHPIGAMFMVSKAGETGAKPGGCLMTWHTHGWPFAAPGKQSVEMIHVWTLPVPGGPFAHESGPDYARIYLNKPPVPADEVNGLISSLYERFQTKSLDPATIAAVTSLAFGTPESRCADTGREAMDTIGVSKALQKQVCDPLLSAPVPGQDSSLFGSLASGIRG